MVVAGDAFDSFYFRALHLSDRNETAVYNFAVNENRTGAALAFAATFLRSGQVQLLAQYVEQARHRMRVKPFRFPVHDKGKLGLLIFGLHIHRGFFLLLLISKHIMSNMLDWGTCKEVERVEGKVSGAWVFRGSRVPVRALFENLESGASIDDFLK